MATGLLRRLALAPPELAPPAAGRLSFQQVYEQHFRYIWRCLRSLGVGEHALDDACHDVFLVVQRKLPSFDASQARVTTWLYEIALRVARGYRSQTAREARRRAPLAAPEHDPPSAELGAELGAAPSGEPGCELEHAERLALARRALDALDADKREVFVLGCIEQRSAPEIAGLTGVPLNTVYSRLRAARRLFSAQLARLDAA